MLKCKFGIDHSFGQAIAGSVPPVPGSAGKPQDAGATKQPVLAWAQKLGCASDSLRPKAPLFNRASGTLHGPGIFFPGQRNVVRRERAGLRTYLYG